MTEVTVLGQTSTTESVQSPVEAVKATEVVKPLEPTQEEVLSKKIEEAVAKALASETEKSRREIQSTKDKAIAEVQLAERRRMLAERTMEATQKQIQTLDPETAKEFELARLRAESQGRLSLEQEEVARQSRMDFDSQFNGSLVQFIQNMGVDPTNPSIDWAKDATSTGDYLTAQRRVLDSVAKIQKENAKNLEMSIEARVKEVEKKVRKDLGIDEVNSVSAQMSGGAVSGSGIPTDLGKFRTWVSDLSSADYKKLKPEIEKMMAEGKIK